jgi:hypothetical protein
VADLNGRGQLLLVGAFALAVTLVALTVALTASNYTGTLATESDEITQGGHAISVRESVEHDVERLLVRANSGETGYGPRETILSNSVPVIADGVAAHHADDGRRVAAELTGSPFTDGVRIKQTGTGAFTDPIDSDEKWRLASSTTVRNATFVFEKTSSPSVLATTPSDGYKLVLGDWSADTAAWELALYRDGTDWKLRVTGPSGTSKTCSRPALSLGGEMTVDVDAATVDGEYCDALAFFEPTASHDVWFEEGLAVRGRYWLTVQGDQSSIGRTYSATSPDHADEVLYSATLDFRYVSATVDYETEITVAPGDLS